MAARMRTTLGIERSSPGGAVHVGAVPVVIAVHGAIALADALVVACEGDRCRGEDHRKAARRIRSWCSAKAVAETGVKHFEWLIDKKTHFSYDDRRVEPYELQMAKVKMDQFFAWVFSTFPAVAQVKEASDA